MLAKFLNENVNYVKRLKMHIALQLWRFAEIAVQEPARAKLLESAPASQEIADSVLARFESAVTSGHLRIGMEPSDSNPSDYRVTLQFLIGKKLSDQFFNAKTGYRAQFRLDWQGGIAYNRSIVLGVRNLITTLLPSTVIARRLSSNFEDIGAMEVSREQVYASLDPDLSKVWFCGRLITGDGQVVQLPLGVTGPRLWLDDQTSWAAIARDEQDAWLEVKSAFVGVNGLYQPKSPIERAKKLQACGEA